MANQKTDGAAEKRKAGKRESGNLRPEAGDGRVLVTSRGLAVALGVSLRTVERMLAAGEIVPVRVRGVVRFYVSDVVEALRKGKQKFGRQADLTAESAKIAGRGPAGAGNPKSDQPKSEGNPKFEIRDPKQISKGGGEVEPRKTGKGFNR